MPAIRSPRSAKRMELIDGLYAAGVADAETGRRSSLDRLTATLAAEIRRVR